MAEILEDESVNDRDIDRIDYIKENMNLLKHRFRESASTAEEKSLQSSFEDGFKLITPIVLKLGRLRGGLSILKLGPDSSSKEVILRTLTKDLDAILDELRGVKVVDWKDDATVDPESDNLPINLIPQFVKDDMTSLFGHIETSQVDISINPDQDPMATSRMMKQKLDELLHKSEIVLQSGCELLHAVGICDQFVHVK